MLDILVFFTIIISIAAYTINTLDTNTSEKSYLFASKDMGWMALTSTLVMTEFNSATLISFASLGYIAGSRALLLPLIFLIGLLFYAFVVAKKWKSFDGSSVAGFFSERYSPFFGICASILLQCAMLGFSAVYLKSLALIFSQLIPFISFTIMSLIMALLAVLLCIRGGLASILKADTFGCFLLIGFFAALLYYIPTGNNILSIATMYHSDILPTSYIISLIILTTFTYILAPWYGQKIFAARSTSIAFSSSFAAAIIVCSLYAIAIYSTIMFKAAGGISITSEHSFIDAISLYLPAGFVGIGYAIFFIASVTTLTGVWNALCAMFIADVLNDSDIERESVTRSIIITLGYALLTFLLSISLIDSIFQKMILANIPSAALAFSLLAGFYWKSSTVLSAYTSSSFSVVATIFCYLFFGEENGYTWYWACIVLPLSFLVGISTVYAQNWYKKKLLVSSF